MSAEPSPARPDAAGSPPQTVEEVIRRRLSTALGGWRGSLETALPMVVFVLAWTISHDVRLSAGSALVTAALAGALRAHHGGSLQHVVSGFFATGIAAFFALRSGRAEDAFLPGILLSSAYGAGTVLSIVSRWPLVGFLIGVGDPRAKEDPFAWRRDPGVVRVATRLTLVLVVLYAVRLGVMIPLYLAGNVPALGIARLVLGWPAWVAALAVMGWLLARGQTPIELSQQADDPAPDIPPGHGPGTADPREPGDAVPDATERDGEENLPEPGGGQQDRIR